MTLAELRDVHAQTATMRDFLAIWQDMCAGAVVPAPGAFNPLRFGRITQHLTLMEARGPLDYRFRLVARGLQELVGKSYANFNPLSLFSAAEQPTRDWQYRQVMGIPCGFYQRSEVTSAGRVLQHGEYVMLPLRSRSGAIDQILYAGDTIALADGLGDKPGLGTGLPKHFGFVDLGAGTPQEDGPPAP